MPSHAHLMVVDGDTMVDGGDVLAKIPAGDDENQGHHRRFALGSWSCSRLASRGRRRSSAEIDGVGQAWRDR